MAKKYITQLIDDIDGTVIDDGATVRFSLEGHDYEVDLSTSNAEKLREALAPYVEAGRPISRRSGGQRGTVARTMHDVAAIREWAAQNGHAVNERGRIPASVRDAYKASL